MHWDRVQRLVDLYNTVSQLAAQPDPTKQFAAALKEWSYVYRRATTAEQGEYHTYISNQNGFPMVDNTTPDPRIHTEVRTIIRELRDRANTANMLQNDNVDYKLNIDLRNFTTVWLIMVNHF